jgi:transcriptional regulator with XRE-family HTH domain
VEEQRTAQPDAGVAEADGPGADRTSSIGLYLSGQRRLRGISIDDLAQRTRIPRRNIERLESGAFDASPDGFSRGFVRTIAQALGLDPDEAVMRHMREPAAEDAERARAAQGRRLLLFIGVTVSLVIALGFAAKLVAKLLTPDPQATQERPGLVYRRDAVRELVDVGGDSRGEEVAGDAEAARLQPPDPKR